MVLDVTPSGAILTLDGKHIGPAKDFRQELSAGTHVIEISADGYVTAKTTVTITAGKTSPVSQSLAAIGQPKRPREEVLPARPLPRVPQTPPVTMTPPVPLYGPSLYRGPPP